MHNIDVIDNGFHTRIAHQTGDNLLDTLRSAGINIQTGCQKTGGCALCKIFVRMGNAGPVTTAEELQLGYRLLLGMRLACQVIPEGDLVIELIARTVVSEALVMQSEHQANKVLRAEVPKTGYGIAIDVGTTNVSMSIFQWNNGERLAGRIFSNPQGDYGTDVIARLLKASEGKNIAADLQKKLFVKIKETLQEMVQTAAIDLKDITGIGVVGNTAMIAFIHNCAYEQLLDPKYWETPLAFCNTDKTGISEFLQICRDASVEIIDPLAGFVGSDLLAGVTATRFVDKEAKTLFLDFGTNTEIALWDGRTVWVTAAAGGPAFEGSGMSYGTAAVPGAIFRVSRSDEPGTQFKALTIEGMSPTGICGSGYVDIISMLLDLNLLDHIGRFTEKTLSEPEIAIIENPVIKVTKKDIDTLQRAKAAVAAGIRGLLHRAGMSAMDIRQIYVVGNFGRFLDIPNAQRIGLLPSIHPDKVYLYDNAALRGCEDIMLYQAAREMLAEIREKAKYINLASDSEFESLFVESLYLKPF